MSSDPACSALNAARDSLLALQSSNATKRIEWHQAVDSLFDDQDKVVAAALAEVESARASLGCDGPITPGSPIVPSDPPAA